MNTLFSEMGTRGPLPAALQVYVLALYRRGMLATLDEGALIAGVTRGAVLAWLRAKGINWRRERQRYLAKERTRAVLAAEGKPRRRRTKAELRTIADNAKVKWDQRTRT